MKESLILAFLVFFPFLGGIAACIIGNTNEKARDYFADIICILECVIMVVLFAKYGAHVGEEGVLSCTVSEICGFGLHFTLDGFRLIYATVAALMWMMTTILSREYFTHHGNRNRFYLFLLLTLGATMGVFLSEDLYTTFIFFEIMSFTSYVWVAQEENEPSLRAAATYLAVAVIGGMVMLMGLFMVYNCLGTLTISEILPLAAAYENKKLLYAAGICMLVGFGAKAGAFPLHIWLPKAHPVAPAPASALLSGILTKTGVFGILAVSCNLFLHDEKWGELILAIGVCTMFGGAFLAVFSIDLKRTLACSSMSQIGFIMVGVGMQCLLGEENALAVHGTLLHMVNHSMIKLVLFMAAGVIFMNTHALDLNEIRGFGRKKPLLMGIFLIGALTIGGIPGLGGYISKTLLHESIVEYGHEVHSMVITAVEWIFLFSGGLTLAYMTKLFVAIFVEKNADDKKQQKFDAKKKYMNIESTFALAGSALLLTIWGVCSGSIMDPVAEMGQGFMHLEEVGEEVHYFSMGNLKGAMISVIIGAVVYFGVIRTLLMKEEAVSKKRTTRVYINAWPAWLDLENLIYRPVLLQVIPYISMVVCRIFDKMTDTLGKVLPFVGLVFFRIFDTSTDGVTVFLRKTLYKDSPLPYEHPEGDFFTDAVGNFLNGTQGVWRKVFRRKAHKKDYVHRLAMQREGFWLSVGLISRSLSFGLLLVGVGFLLTMIYLLRA
ncbi:MAG: NADH dehydrogenase [Clostridiales bacterium]|nr:NADH dehydrogenase [Candidatus Blautia equi]